MASIWAQVALKSHHVLGTGCSVLGSLLDILCRSCCGIVCRCASILGCQAQELGSLLEVGLGGLSCKTYTCISSRGIVYTDPLNLEVHIKCIRPETPDQLSVHQPRFRVSMARSDSNASRPQYATAITVVINVCEGFSDDADASRECPGALGPQALDMTWTGLAEPYSHVAIRHHHNAF